MAVKVFSALYLFVCSCILFLIYNGNYSIRSVHGVFLLLQFLLKWPDSLRLSPGLKEPLINVTVIMLSVIPGCFWYKWNDYCKDKTILFVVKLGNKWNRIFESIYPVRDLCRAFTTGHSDETEESSVGRWSEWEDCSETWPYGTGRKKYSSCRLQC